MLVERGSAGRPERAEGAARGHAWTRHAAALGLACLALGCRTGDRLWRISPFEGGATSERVNLWPLAYHDRDETSVLWPLFDVDQRGFALRPLVAKDGAAWSVLFPLASFDTQEGEGWAVPFYWFDENAGLFPLANFGGLSWVGPVWWREHDSGLFPLAHFGGLNYVGPVWWRGAPESHQARGGLFPLAMFGPTSYVGPAWWGEGGSFGLFPLFGVDLLGSGIDHVGPVWWRAQREEGFEGGLAPILWYGDGGDSFALLPLYSHDLAGGTRTRNGLLGLVHASSSQTKRESWLLPLYYHREDGPRDEEPSDVAKSDTVLLPFFWKHRRGTESDLYTLLGNRSRDERSESLNVYPLWWSHRDEDSAWRMLFPLFSWEREGDRRTLLTPLGGRGWSATGEQSFVNVLGPLYHHSENRAADEALTAFLWPLFEHRRHADEDRTRVLGLWSRTTTPDESETTWGLGLGHARRTPAGSSQRLWPLYSWSDEPELPGPFYRLTLFGRQKNGDRTRQRLFPFYSSESEPGAAEWSALFGLVHHERLGGANDEKAEVSWRVWPLVSRSNGARPSLADSTALFGTARWAGGQRTQIGASLLWSRAEEENTEHRTRSSRALLVFTHDEETFVAPRVPRPDPFDSGNRIQRDARGFLFEAFVNERETYRAWRDGVLSAEEARVLRGTALGDPHEGVPDRAAARQVLAAHGLEPASDDPAALHQAIADFAAEHTETRTRHHLRVPLLFGYERTSDELDWSGPLGLVHYDSAPERSRFSLLYYAYRSETRGDRTTRDLFPFVTWDSGPGETEVSFLWRLFHYQRRGGRRGGHVFFVPWGNA